MAAEWPSVTLQEAGVSLIDCEHRTPPAQEHGDPYVGIPQVKDGRIDLNGARRITRKHFNEWTRKADPQSYDVVLSRRCNPGETGSVSEGLRFALGQNLVLLRSDGTKVFKPFLRWLVRGPQWWEQVSKYINVGAVFDSLKCADIPAFRLSIPTLPEQRTIAHILGTLDDKIELNRRMNETLEAMVRAVFKSWFVDFDPVRAKTEGRDTGLPANVADLFPDRLVPSDHGQIPEGWRNGRIHEVASLNPESWSEKHRPVKLAYVDLTNTKWGHIERVDTFLWDEAPSRARRVLRRGDTIIATVRPGNGSFALIDEDGLTGSTGFAVVRPKEVADRELVWCAGTSSENIDRLTRLSDGGAYPAVHGNEVASTPITLADPATRTAFSRLAGALLDRVESNRYESRCLSALRDVLLPMLMSGKLLVGNPEPAIVRLRLS